MKPNYWGVRKSMVKGLNLEYMVVRALHHRGCKKTTIRVLENVITANI